MEIVVKLEENFPSCLTFIENTIYNLLLNFSCVSRGLDNSCSNEYEADVGIQNKTAKGLLMSHFSQYISLKNKVSLWAKLHTRLTSVCLFVRFFYQHGDFLLETRGGGK